MYVYERVSFFDDKSIGLLEARWSRGVGVVEW